MKHKKPVGRLPPEIGVLGPWVRLVGLRLASGDIAEFVRIQDSDYWICSICFSKGCFFGKSILQGGATSPVLGIQLVVGKMTTAPCVLLGARPYFGVIIPVKGTAENSSGAKFWPSTLR